MKRVLLAVITLAFIAIPLQVSAHGIERGSIVVNCTNQTVTIGVHAWKGNVEIVKLPSGPTTEVKPTLDSKGNGSATIDISAIGGNGTYTAGRQGHPKDPVPVRFTVDCPGSGGVLGETAGIPLAVTGLPVAGGLGGVLLALLGAIGLRSRRQ